VSTSSGGYDSAHSRSNEAASRASGLCVFRADKNAKIGLSAPTTEANANDPERSDGSLIVTIMVMDFSYGLRSSAMR
jgi:hypothetical protein